MGLIYCILNLKESRNLSHLVMSLVPHVRVYSLIMLLSVAFAIIYFKLHKQFCDGPLVILGLRTVPMPIYHCSKPCVLPFFISQWLSLLLSAINFVISALGRDKLFRI